MNNFGRGSGFKKKLLLFYLLSVCVVTFNLSNVICPVNFESLPQFISELWMHAGTFPLTPRFSPLPHWRFRKSVSSQTLQTYSEKERKNERALHIHNCSGKPQVRYSHWRQLYSSPSTIFRRNQLNCNTVPTCFFSAFSVKDIFHERAWLTSSVFSVEVSHCKPWQHCNTTRLMYNRTDEGRRKV